MGLEKAELCVRCRVCVSTKRAVWHFPNQWETADWHQASKRLPSCTGWPRVNESDCIRNLNKSRVDSFRHLSDLRMKRSVDAPSTLTSPTCECRIPAAIVTNSSTFFFHFFFFLFFLTALLFLNVIFFFLLSFLLSYLAGGGGQ